ncbi:MAG: cytochrome c, partial [Desulfuromonadales bacterium]
MATATRIILALSMVAFLATSALAVEGGNPTKGKYLFKKDCRTCHVEGMEGGNLTPMAKTMAQWDRFFQENKHQVKPEVMKDLSE